VPATWRNVGVDINVDDLMSSKKSQTSSSSPMKQVPPSSGLLRIFWYLLQYSGLLTFFNFSGSGQHYESWTLLFRSFCLLLVEILRKFWLSVAGNSTSIFTKLYQLFLVPGKK